MNLTAFIEGEKEHFSEKFRKSLVDDPYSDKEELNADDVRLLKILSDTFSSSLHSLLEKVAEMAETSRRKFRPEDAGQDILFTDPTAVDGYNRAIDDLLSKLRESK